MVYIQNDGITQIPHSAAFVKFLDCWFVWSGFGKMQVVYHIPSGLVEISQKHIIRVFTYPRKKRQNSSPLLEGNSRDSQKSLTPPYTSPHITPYKQAWLYIYIYVCIIYIHINIHIYIYIYTLDVWHGKLVCVVPFAAPQDGTNQASGNSPCRTRLWPVLERQLPPVSTISTRLCELWRSKKWMGKMGVYRLLYRWWFRKATLKNHDVVRHYITKVADLSPKNMFGNKQSKPQMVPSWI